MAVVVPAWKQALIERKKKQEEKENAKKMQEEKKKLASLPAWKRAILLREKLAKVSGGASRYLAGANMVASHADEQRSEKWQVAVERVKGLDSPILKKTSWPRSSNPNEEEFSLLSSPKQPAKMASMSFSGGSAQSVSQKSHFTDLYTESGNKAPTASIDTSSLMLEAASSAYSTPSAKSMGSAVVRVEVEGPNLTGLPAWKKILVLKKQKSRPRITIDDETKRELADKDKTELGDMLSGKPSNSAIRKESGLFTAPTNPSTQQQQPEVVNRASNKLADQRLIQQEGKTLHPPIYKEVDQWANVREDDDKFKNSPLWKQALIRRRRADIAIRSGKPLLPIPMPVQAPIRDIAKGTKVTKPSPGKITLTADSKKSSRRQPEAKSRIFHTRNGKTTTEKSSNQQQGQEIISSVENKKSTINKPVRNETALKPVRNEAALKPVRREAALKPIRSEAALKPVRREAALKPVRNEAALKPVRNEAALKPVRSEAVLNSVRNEAALKPVRKAPALPMGHAKKIETMFDFNFSKSLRHCDDTCSSNSTDSDLEEAIVTNLDEVSDESDSGIVLRNYRPLGEKEHPPQKPPQNTSILGGSKKIKKVSFNCVEYR